VLAGSGDKNDRFTRGQWPDPMNDTGRCQVPAVAGF
jgi:hypothetical protein